RRHTRFSRDWSSDVCSSDLFFSYLEFVFYLGRYGGLNTQFLSFPGRRRNSGAHHKVARRPVCLIRMLNLGAWARHAALFVLAYQIGRASCRERMYSSALAVS